MGFARPNSQHETAAGIAPGKRVANGLTADSPNPAVPGHFINLSFNVPFNSHLAGPEKDDVLYSSIGAFQKWIHPEGAGDDTPNYALPIHTRNVENLRSLCKQISEAYGDRINATVTSSKPKPVPGMQRGPLTALVTNVCISGDAHLVTQQRRKILNETPITLVSTVAVMLEQILTTLLANCLYRRRPRSHLSKRPRCRKSGCIEPHGRSGRQDKGRHLPP